MSNILIVKKADFSQNGLGTNSGNKNYLPLLKKGTYNNADGNIKVIVEENNIFKISYTGSGAAASIDLPLEKEVTLAAGTYYGHLRNNAALVSGSASSIIAGGTTIAAFNVLNRIREDVLGSSLTFSKIRISIVSDISDADVTAQLSMEDVGYVTEWTPPIF